MEAASRDTSSGEHVLIDCTPPNLYAVEAEFGAPEIRSETPEPGDAKQDPSIGRVCPDFTWYLAGWSWA